MADMALQCAVWHGSQFPSAGSLCAVRKPDSHLRATLPVTRRLLQSGDLRGPGSAPFLAGVCGRDPGNFRFPASFLPEDQPGPGQPAEAGPVKPRGGACPPGRAFLPVRSTCSRGRYCPDGRRNVCPLMRPCASSLRKGSLGEGGRGAGGAHQVHGVARWWGGSRAGAQGPAMHLSTTSGGPGHAPLQLGLPIHKVGTRKCAC